MAKLTKHTVTTSKATATEQIIWDDEVKGFGLRISPVRQNAPNGQKTYILKFRLGKGRSAPVRKPTLGRVGELTLDEARKKAADWKRLGSDGIDPVRKLAIEGRTVNDLLDRYVTDYIPTKREASGDRDKRKIAQYIRPKLGRKLLKDLTFDDIETLHRSMRRTPVHANRTVSLLHRMLNLAIRWEWITSNPAEGTERYPEEKRQRYLTPAEIGRLAAALETYVEQAHRPKQAQSIADAFRLLLLTGARRGEVLAAKWEQFDLGAGVWTKPSSATKQASLHRAPLSAPALQLLQEIMAREQNEVYVFPARPGSEHGHLTELKTGWAKVCKLAELDGVRIHDLRHTFASISVSGGASLPMIGALLGHTQVQTTQRYSHLLDEPLRAVAERVGSVVSGTATGNSAEIVKIGKS